MRNLTVTESFANVGVTQRATLSSNASASNLSTDETPTTVTYNATDRTYRIAGDNRSQTLGPSDRSPASDSVLTIYERTTGTIEDQIVINNPTGTPPLVFTYVNFGAWQRINTSGATSLDVKSLWFVYGVPTTTADMPRTGSANYSTEVNGFWTDANGSYAAYGSSSFSADFGAGRTTANMNISAENILNNSTRNFGTVTGTGTISGVGFSSPLTASNGYAGSINGLFFGPQAVEMGGAFSLTNASGSGSLVGVLTGRKN